MELKFYVCKHCGNIITYINNAGVPVVCCGEKMQEIVPGAVEASHEKHIPVIEKNGNDVLVKIGAVPHPMQPEHYIEWIVLQTKEGCQIKHLTPNDKPEAKFAVASNDEVIGAFDYCNIHGLWKK